VEQPVLSRAISTGCTPLKPRESSENGSLHRTFGHAQTFYEGLKSCEPDWGNSCNDVCVKVVVAGKTTWLCDIDTTTGTDADAWVIALYDNSDADINVCASKPYCAWGVTSAGDPFTCGWDDEGGSLIGVTLKGGSANDHLSFLCEQGGNPPDRVYMMEWAGYDLPTEFRGIINGRAGDDQIIGSRRDHSDYQDRLEGDDGADDIVGHEGADYITGGAHADRICGGAGDDGLVGGGNNDLICGEGGADHLTGALGSDSLFGGTGTDVFTGGSGTSNTCDNETSETATDCTSSIGVEACDGSDTGLGIECPPGL